MKISPFRSDADLLKFSNVFLRAQVGSYRKDMAICLTADKAGHHAYFPALMTSIGFADFLSGLYAGTLDRHGLIRRRRRAENTSDLTALGRGQTR